MNFYDLFRRAKRLVLYNLLKSSFGFLEKDHHLIQLRRSLIIRIIHIGNNVYIGQLAMLSADNVKIKIGDAAIIGPGVCIRVENRLFDKPGLLYHDSPKGINKDIMTNMGKMAEKE